MQRHGLARAGEVAAAQGEELVVQPRTANRPAAPYYVEEIRKQLLAHPEIGPERLYHGGLRITAALDVEQQFALEREVMELLPPDPRLDAGVAAVDPTTGDVLAAWSGRDFAASQVDLALRQSSGRPSGSTFKVFALGAALEDGKSLQSRYPSPGRLTIGTWSPSGANGCGNPCSLLEATVRSSNTAFASVARDVGTVAFTEMAYRLGVRSTLSQDPGELAQVLGTADVTPLDMASAFGTIANDGVACPARLMTEVRAADGSPLPVPDPRQPTEEQRERWAAHLTELGYDFGDEELGRCYRAVAPSVARSMTVALEQAVTRGTGTNAMIDRPAAGKTGTTQDSRMVWFAGYTPHLSMAVAFGGVAEQMPLRSVPGCGRSCFGGQLPAAMWRQAALALHAGVEPEPFPEPIEDERVVPDRRRLGTPGGSGGSGRRPAGGSAEPAPEPEPTPTPDREPELGPTPEPVPEATTGPEPAPDGDGEEPASGGGLLGPLFGGGGDGGDDDDG
jgi:membrane peptidoglycan carboxypeptidase